ncbi:MAG: hypothetical protein PUC65_17610 [Clostridiales bacterium]|nr:hypothetical protein [Clostridiales bacterium]
MDHVEKNKEVNTNDKKITGDLKAMYYFLLGVSIVIPVFFMMKLVYLDVFAIDGSLASHTQYYLWNSPKLFKEILKETADGGFFLMVALIPVFFIVMSLVNSVVSIVRAIKVKISWKHAEAVNHVCTSSIIASASFIVLYNIISEFFELKSGFSGQNLKCNAFIFMILGLAIVGKIVAVIYFKKIKERHLF